MVASSGIVTLTVTLDMSISGMKMKPRARLTTAVTTKRTAEADRIIAL